MESCGSHFDVVQWLPEEAAEAFLGACKTRALPARSTIYVQGEDGNQMFRILSGSVRLAVLNANGRELLYQLFGPGDCFGQASIVDYEPRPHTAEAYSACTLQIFEKDAINDLRERFPSISDALLRVTSRQLRVLSAYFAASQLGEPATRVAQRLVMTVDHLGVATNEGMSLGTRLSQSELAMMVGASRQTVNKVLRDLQMDGLVSVQHRGLTILDLPRLRAMAGAETA